MEPRGFVLGVAAVTASSQPDHLLRLKAYAPVQTRDVLLGIIDAVLEAGLTPKRYGVQDGAIRLRFNREAIERDAGKVLAEGTFYAEGPQGLCIYLWASSGALSIEQKIPQHPSDADKAGWLRMVDRIRETMVPEFLAMSWAPSLRVVPRGWASDRERTERLMLYGMHGGSYYRTGPSGLAYRTYLCAHYAELFGADALSSLPATVTYLDDGSVCIDLYDDLLHASFGDLVDRWTDCMQILYRREVFTVPRINEEHQTIVYDDIRYENRAPRFVHPPREER